MTKAEWELKQMQFKSLMDCSDRVLAATEDLISASKVLNNHCREITNELQEALQKGLDL